MLACDSVWIDALQLHIRLYQILQVTQSGKISGPEHCHSHSVPRPWPMLPLPPTPLQHRQPAVSPLSRMMSYSAAHHRNWPRDDFNHLHTVMGTPWQQWLTITRVQMRVWQVESSGFLEPTEICYNNWGCNTRCFAWRSHAPFPST